MRLLSRTETLIHLFGNDVSTWIQSCQVPLQNNHLSMKTTLGLKPDSSENKLQINFCCLTTKYYIWLYHSKEHVSRVGNHLQFLKQIHQMENNTTTPFISLVSHYFSILNACI